MARDADAVDIKKSYKKIALKNHPDRNPDDESAVERFKEAAEAFEVLSNPDKRARFDRFGHAGLQAAAASSRGSPMSATSSACSATSSTDLDWVEDLEAASPAGRGLDAAAICRPGWRSICPTRPPGAREPSRSPATNRVPPAAAAVPVQAVKPNRATTVADMDALCSHRASSAFRPPARLAVEKDRLSATSATSAVARGRCHGRSRSMSRFPPGSIRG